jgi:hypothetical protein
MQNLSLHINTPVFLQEEHFPLIPPIAFNGVVYIVHEKKFFLILSAVKKIQNYIHSIREKGYDYSTTWLKNNGLLNAGFLECASKYYISNGYYDKSNQFITCRKDLFSDDKINQIFFNSFKSAITNKIIYENKEKFNEYVESRLHPLEIEIKDGDPNRSKYIHKHIYKSIINGFLNTIENIDNELSRINNINISAKSDLVEDDFTIYNVYSVKNMSNFNFKKHNPANIECLSLNTRINLTLHGLKSYDLEELIEYSNEFVSNKIDHEKSYLQSFFPHCNDKDSDAGITKRTKTNNAVKTKNRIKVHNSAQTSFINSIYMNANYSNFMIDSIENFEKTCFVLNVDDNLHSVMQNILNNKKTSTITRLASNNEYTMPVGYTVLEI